MEPEQGECPFKKFKADVAEPADEAVALNVDKNASLEFDALDEPVEGDSENGKTCGSIEKFPNLKPKPHLDCTDSENGLESDDNYEEIESLLDQALPDELKNKKRDYEERFKIIMEGEIGRATVDGKLEVWTFCVCRERSEPLRAAAGRLGTGDARQRNAFVPPPPLTGLLSVASLLPWPRIGAQARDPHQFHPVPELPEGARKGAGDDGAAEAVESAAGAGSGADGGRRVERGGEPPGVERAERDAESQQQVDRAGHVQVAAAADPKRQGRDGLGESQSALADATAIHRILQEEIQLQDDPCDAV